MAALTTLLDVETEIETSLKTFLAASPYSLSAVQGDSATQLSTPRVEVMAEVVQWGPHQYTITAGTHAGTNIYDQFRIRAKLDVTFQPEQSQSPGTMRGKVRAALSNWTGLKAAFATRNYLLLASDTLRQTDGGRSINDEEKTETLSTVLDLVVFLNPNELNVST